jgi:hypothetical protein
VYGIAGLPQTPSSSATVDALVRLLRPASVDPGEYSNALKQKLKQVLVSRAGGPMLAAKFDKYVLWTALE